jgi:hypothetical protein
MKRILDMVNLENNSLYMYQYNKGSFNRLDYEFYLGTIEKIGSLWYFTSIAGEFRNSLHEQHLIKHDFASYKDSIYKIGSIDE